MVHRVMPRWFSYLALCLTCASLAAAGDPPAPAAAPSIPPLLLEALGKIARNYDRWAYTETRLATDEHARRSPERSSALTPRNPTPGSTGRC